MSRPGHIISSRTLGGTRRQEAVSPASRRTRSQTSSTPQEGCATSAGPDSQCPCLLMLDYSYSCWRYRSMTLAHPVFGSGLVSAPHPKLRLRELGPQIFIILRGDSRVDQVYLADRLRTSALPQVREGLVEVRAHPLTLCCRSEFGLLSSAPVSLGLDLDSPRTASDAPTSTHVMLTRSSISQLPVTSATLLGDTPALS